MPELPEVEAIVRGLREDGLEGSRLKSASVLRATVTRPQDPAHVEALSSKVTVKRVERRAKNILVDLGNGYTIKIHLRMSGGIAIYGASHESPPTARAVWTLSRGRRLIFTDFRALGNIHVHPTLELAELLSHLGPEPLSRAFTADQFIARARNSRLPAKLYLMDQSKVAGLGNIYAVEALFHAGISPQRLMNSIRSSRLATLHGAIKETLRRAVHSVYKTYRSPSGYRPHLGEFKRFVYGRAGEPCLRCGRPIQRIKQAGRSTYYCSHCQR
jgi:formamidopyrimidine-DNA glycosylase